MNKNIFFLSFSFLCFYLCLFTICAKGQISFNFSDSLFYTKDEISNHKSISISLSEKKSNKQLPVVYQTDKELKIQDNFTAVDCDPDLIIDEGISSQNGTFQVFDYHTYNQPELVSDLSNMNCSNQHEEPKIYDVTRVPKTTVKKLMDNMITNIPMNYNNHVQNHIDYFTFKKPGYLQTILNREYKFIQIFEETLKKYNLPDELKYLVIVESGINPTAISRSGAAGLWQFIPFTGNLFNLDITKHMDERMDPYKSTEAAALYLKELYSYFNDWHLVLAAYNCGPGAVSRMIKRKKLKNFWALYPYLPKETRSYVPSFICFTFLMKYSHLYGICADSLENKFQFDTLQIRRPIDLNVFSKQIQCDPSLILTYNPEIKTNIIQGTEEKPYILRIPYIRTKWVQNREEELLNLSAIALPENRESILSEGGKNDSSFTNEIVYKVKQGDVIFRIAEQFNIEIADLKNWNNLTGNDIFPGQELVIQTNKPKGNSSTQLASNSETGKVLYENNKTKTLRKIKIHEVGNGDTLWSIAQKYEGMTVADLKRLNNLRGNTILPGQKLVLK